MSVFQSNFLVIGSGVAGLTCALKAAEYGTVNLVTKKEAFESNTNYAQGGIAVVLDPLDCFDSHIEDTLVAGAGLCHPDAVEVTVQNGPRVVEELRRWGTDFTPDRSGDGLELGREGGHSRRRIVHAKDLTGREVERALLEQIHRHEKTRVFQHTLAIDLLVEENNEGRCWGCAAWDDTCQEVHYFTAGVIILATGGLGRVYLHTTNPSIATGDGVAMAYRQGIPIANMEFIQFHPTAFFSSDEETFLISEAVRGEGGILRTSDGTAFMEDYHELKDLAPRDIVARALDAEMKKRGDSHAFLDVTHLNQKEFSQRFPNISRYCRDHHLDLSRDMIPVVPAAHYSCGGIVTGLSGETSLRGLFAAGEVACTGLHGANRLASNSILEALVFGGRAIELAYREGLHKESCPASIIPRVRVEPKKDLETVRISHCREALRRLMWDYVGIVRSEDRLRRAQDRIRVLREEVDDHIRQGFTRADLFDLRNMVEVSDLIVGCALTRKESRGLHYIREYPEPDEQWKKDTIVRRDNREAPLLPGVRMPV
ncbi:MAG: L-aspartate oxidase [bacterium]